MGIDAYIASIQAGHTRPTFKQVSNVWEIILKGNEYLVFIFLHDHIAYMASTTDPGVAKIRKRTHGGVWCSNDTMAKRTGLSLATIERMIELLVNKGLLIRVTDKCHPNVNMRRVFYINTVTLARLDAAWMKIGNTWDKDLYDFYEDFVDARQKSVEQEWEIIQAEGTATDDWITAFGAEMGVPLKMRGTTPQNEGVIKQDLITRRIEVSSSKIPGAVEDSSAQEGSVPLSSRRRIPQGLLTPQADPAALFKRNGNATPGKEAATAADTRVADSLLAYWNKALPHKKQSKHKRNGDGEVNKYYKGFVSKVDKLLNGTLFAAHEVDPKYARKFSVNEVRKAIDHFALYPADLQQHCKNIEDFMRSEVPNKQPFRNGCGRSWMLRCLFGDDPHKPLPLTDGHPELTSAIIDQYCRQVLKGSIHQFDVIDRNHFIQAAAGLHTFYEANNHKLAAASNDVIRLARSLVQVVSKWGTPSPAALHSSRMFTEHLPQSLFSQHAMIDKTAKDQGEGYAATEAPIDIYAPLTIPEEYL